MTIKRMIRNLLANNITTVFTVIALLAIIGGLTVVKVVYQTLILIIM
jgi:hypothetical protein